MVSHMIVSLHKGTSIQTLIYYGPYYGDPEKGTLNFGKSSNIANTIVGAVWHVARFPPSTAASFWGVCIRRVLLSV